MSIYKTENNSWYAFIYNKDATIQNQKEKIAALETQLKTNHEVINRLLVAVKKTNDDYWFMINLIERYGSDKDQTLKDVLERMKLRKPMYETLAELKNE
jgi:gamma-glutamyl:cysteine ligase YbdK (ATP-grasp superfamily)